MASPQFGFFNLPQVDNEPLLNYGPGSYERNALTAAVAQAKAAAPVVPVVINGKQFFTGKVCTQRSPTNHSQVVCTYHEADDALVDQAIQGALEAKASWELLPFHDRAAIFLKAADLLSTTHRWKTLAATMIGQGKNAWQAEIDAAAELIDFWRFNCTYAAEIYSQQPPKNSPRVWNRLEYRPLEGFVLAISPFNFTAIGGNLCSAPALMGNVVVWKPAPNAMLSNYIVYQILVEAGLPPGVIQFVPGPAPEIVGRCLNHADLAAVHFTGSTLVFKHIWKQVALNIDNYKSYPRLVGETGGKNMHFVHKSADVTNVVNQTIRAAFEYQGQKCSACSRMYVPESLWEQVKQGLLAEHAKLKVGDVNDYTNFVTAVINDGAFKKISGYIDGARASSDHEILAGGKYDDSVGYFIHPTIIQTTNPASTLLSEEIFGPVLTVYVYEDDQFDETLKLASSGKYALTGSLFASDRTVINHASTMLRNAAGNFYINDKCTGAVVGQQPFGGSRGSGTNDKAGAAMNLLRWTSARTIKETFVPISSWSYPSNSE